MGRGGGGRGRSGGQQTEVVAEKGSPDQLITMHDRPSTTTPSEILLSVGCAQYVVECDQSGCRFPLFSCNTKK